MVSSDEVRHNITRGDAWMRIFFLVLFGFIYWIASWVMAAVAVVQAGWTLLTSRPNEALRRFGAALAEYLREIALFATYNAEDMPYPFREWPDPYRDEEG